MFWVTTGMIDPRFQQMGIAKDMGKLIFVIFFFENKAVLMGMEIKLPTIRNTALKTVLYSQELISLKSQQCNFP